jgi:hypothetical protein
MLHLFDPLHFGGGTSTYETLAVTAARAWREGWDACGA